MADPDSYIRNLNSIGESIKRHNAQLKILREKKKESEKRLHSYMIKNNMEEYGGYKASKIAPKEKKLVKKKKEKKTDAIRLFSEIGITDPESFWDALQETQKVKSPDEIDPY